MKGVLLLVALALLAGCGDLETAYGVDDAASVNGSATLQRRLEATTRLRRAWMLTPRIREQADLIVHLLPRRDLPDAAACTWLRSWLEAEDGRQAVLVLRDGNLAPWLCRRWAAEAAAEGKGELAERLATRARQEEGDATWTGTAATCPLFSVQPGKAERPRRLHGLEAGAVPLAMHAGLRLAAVDATPLVEAEMADGTRVPWALEVPVGDSRLVVVANAIPLLDGALADPAARRLAGLLLNEIVSYHDGRPAAAWVGELRVRDEEPQPANPIALVLGRAPVAWATWHGIALLLLALWGAGLWLGRREDPRDVRLARFGRHVDALSRLQREGGHAAACVRAIARARGLPAPPADLSEDQARAWLRSQTKDDR